MEISLILLLLTFRTILENENTQYCEFDDDVNFVELYDLDSDPYQLFNVAPQMTQEEREEYSERLDKLRGCKGKEQCFQ